jgi:hypothetical protein
MAHDVFICYSTADKVTADAACAHLEAAGVRCWIAPRDPIPGIPYSRQLVDAIDAARVVLLIFSKNTAQSEHVMRELELAADRNKVIVPFRIDDTQPNADLEYYIRRVHWLDAMSPPMEKRLEELVTLVKRVLGAAPPEPEPIPVPPPIPIPVPKPISRGVLIGGGAAVAFILLIVLVALLPHGHPNTVVAGAATPTGSPRASPAARASTSSSQPQWFKPYTNIAFYAQGINCIPKGNGSSVQIFRIYNGTGERMFFDVGMYHIYADHDGQTTWMRGSKGYRFYLEPKQESDDFHAAFQGVCSNRFNVVLYNVRYGTDSGNYMSLKT